MNDAKSTAAHALMNLRGRAGLTQKELADSAGVTEKTIRKTVATAVYNSDSLDNASQQLGHSEVGVTSKHYVQQSNMGPVEVVGVLDSFIKSVS